MDSSIIKFIIVGETEVGKTTLIHRWVNGVFLGYENVKTTIGVGFAIKKITVNKNQEATLQIWDFAGQSRFGPLLINFLKGTRAGFLVFDLSNPASIDALESFWIPQLSENLKIDFTNHNNRFALIGTKTDIAKKNGYKEDEIPHALQRFLEKYPLRHIFISSKTGENIERLDGLVKEIIPTKSIVKSVQN